MPALKKTILLLWFMILLFLPLSEVTAKIDLVTLSDRDSVETTIYNEADLTLVRDKRVLNLVKGMNSLQFSWANTKIDPTSLSLDIKKNTEKINVVEITYPPETKDVGIWHIKAAEACQAPVEITYFTSGISWQAYYVVILSEDRKTSDLKGYVKVTNNSGEDYSNAVTRLVVGKINILDEIATLAALKHPYGRPELMDGNLERKALLYKGKQVLEQATRPMAMAMDAVPAPARPKEIIKEGLSEYFLYTIEGKESIPHGWSKRLLSLKADKVILQDLFRYDKERFGDAVVRFLTFENKKENKLGETPLPGGEIKVFHSTGKKGELAYIGADTTKYIPVGKKADLNLGNALSVKMVPTVMTFKKENLAFDKKGNIIGFDEVKDYEIKLSNFTGTRSVLEYVQNFDSPDVKITRISHQDRFEKTDQDSIKFTLELAPHASETIRFTTTFPRGDRKWQQ